MVNREKHRLYSICVINVCFYVIFIIQFSHLNALIFSEMSKNSVSKHAFQNLQLIDRNLVREK